MKKIIALIITTILVLTCVSCGKSNEVITDDGNKGEQVKIELPDYDLKKDEIHFLTTAFFSPSISEESMTTYMDCGFDIFCINGNNVGYADSANITEALRIAEEKNIKCVIDATVSRSVDKIGTSMICNDYGYQNFSSLWAVNAFDEPVPRQGDWEDVTGIDTIASFIPKFTSIYGEEMPFFINLNPFGSTRVGNYFDYIKTNVEEILMNVSPKSQRWISCDSYVLIYNPYQDRHFLKSTWLYNLQLIGNTKIDYPELDIKSNFYILSTPHQTGNIDSYMRDIGYNELRIQLYSLIAFGYDMASYFTYATPISAGGESFETALLDRNGEKTQRWNDAKRLNDEIHSFDHVFMQFDHQGVYTVDGTKDNKSNGSFEYLEKMNKNDLGEMAEVNSSADTLIGVGKDKLGNSGYTVVNYNDPYDKINDSVTITFKNADSAYVYVGGEKTVVTLENHTLNLNLGYGEGVFVIPF